MDRMESHVSNVRRVGFVAVGLVLVLGALWFAASWVDAGYDSTCGSVFRPGLWTTTPGCEPVMPLRLVASGVLVAVGLVLAVAGAARPDRTQHRAVVAIAALAVVVMIGLLIINERVRSDGRWSCAHRACFFDL